MRERRKKKFFGILRSCPYGWGEEEVGVVTNLISDKIGPFGRPTKRVDIDINLVVSLPPCRSVCAHL